ncbi:hypothetical protein QUF55_06870 [Clostridiaceae bacterium HSG29]|nr:hypothetical protein [Clostridiaceae bacterium HSG29]
MKNELKVIEINEDKISLDMLNHFEREQTVNKIFYFEDGIKKLKDIYFIDDWNNEERKQIFGDYFVDLKNKKLHVSGIIS